MTDIDSSEAGRGEDWLAEVRAVIARYRLAAELHAHYYDAEKFVATNVGVAARDEAGGPS